MVPLSVAIQEARSWIDTPVVLAGAQKGVGCNCLGMYAGMSRDLGLSSLWEVYKGYQGHARNPTPRLLIRLLDEHLTRVDTRGAGHFLVEEGSTHLLMMTEPGIVMEAAGKFVKEKSLDPRRIILRAYKVPGIDYEQ